MCCLAGNRDKRRESKVMGMGWLCSRIKFFVAKLKNNHFQKSASAKAADLFLFPWAKFQLLPSRIRSSLCWIRFKFCVDAKAQLEKLESEERSERRDIGKSKKVKERRGPSYKRERTVESGPSWYLGCWALWWSHGRNDCWLVQKANLFFISSKSSQWQAIELRLQAHAMCNRMRSWTIWIRDDC